MPEKLSDIVVPQPGECAAAVVTDYLIGLKEAALQLAADTGEFTEDLNVSPYIVKDEGDDAVLRLARRYIARRGGWRERLLPSKKFIDCGVCDGAVALDLSGVHATDCATTRNCEQQWYRDHPELYEPGSTDPAAGTAAKKPLPAALPCGAIGCNAITRILDASGGKLAAPETVRGQCRIERDGPGWKERGAAAFDYNGEG